MPSFSGILTWETILSSNHRMLMGILAPHLSHNAVIPHFTAITPVRLELGVITPGSALIIRESLPSFTEGSAMSVLNWILEKTEAVTAEGECERRLMRPLDTANILITNRISEE